MQNTITIPAREVVPGMSLDGYPIIEVATERDGRIAVHAAGTVQAFSPARDTRVTLPGPSPRAKLCDCSSLTTQDLYPRTAPPERHMADCPVRRLRLRVWPAPLGGVPWTWSVACSLWALRQGSGEIRVHAANLATKLHALHDDNATAAIVRECFCLPAEH